MSPIVGIEAADGVATVTVDRPPVNSMDDDTLAALGDAAERLAADRDVRAVVVTGAGTRAFMAGADIRAFERFTAASDAIREHVRLSRRAFDGWSTIPQPVIAAVHANAFGGGLEFALVCDLIVADPDALLGQPEVRLGLIPGAGATQRLPARVGLNAAKEMLLTGAAIDASRAAELGLVSRVSEPGEALSEARALAADLAELPGRAVGAAKRAVEAGASRSLDEGLDLERELFLDVFDSDDAREGLRAFLEKRPPRFTHR